ncbi:MAG TPA: hypothetical protein PKK06_17135 [Phycisphaerae bacterium]|nr:hypothetical protein [Phycisphaerae bacterium]HNU46888.1 hypothetical protein [Phycisphaerae bacterium]
MKFRYVQDPLFLLCIFAYAVNRFVLKRLWQVGFVHDYLNDLICIPFLVPIMLYVERKLGARGHDGVPQWYELLIPVAVWSVLFEVLLPLHPSLRGVVVGDYMDVLFYVLGACTAGLFWQRWYRVAPVRPRSAVKDRCTAGEISEPGEV